MILSVSDTGHEIYNMKGEATVWQYSHDLQPIEFHGCSFLVSATKKRRVITHESGNNRFLSSISF